MAYTKLVLTVTFRSKAERNILCISRIGTWELDLRKFSPVYVDHIFDIRYFGVVSL